MSLSTEAAAAFAAEKRPLARVHLRVDPQVVLGEEVSRTLGALERAAVRVRPPVLVENVCRGEAAIALLAPETLLTGVDRHVIGQECLFVESARANLTFERLFGCNLPITIHP